MGYIIQTLFFLPLKKDNLGVDKCSTPWYNKLNKGKGNKRDETINYFRYFNNYFIITNIFMGRGCYLLMKKFFGIEEKQYVFEWGDVSALLTVLNVFFIVMGMWWAPFFGLANCVLAIVGMIKANAHLNAYIIQMALIVLNIFFLC